MPRPFRFSEAGRANRFPKLAAARHSSNAQLRDPQSGKRHYSGRVRDADTAKIEVFLLYFA